MVAEGDPEAGQGEQEPEEVAGVEQVKRKPGRPRKKAGTEEAQGSSQGWGRGPLNFLQTYGDNGEVIPLPLDTPLPAGMARLFSGVNGRDDPEHQASKQRSAASKRGIPKTGGASKRGPNLAGETNVVVLPRLPGAPMPPVPELGRPRPARERRPPQDANKADQELAERLAKSKQEKAAKEKERGKETEVAVGGKRKAQENEEPAALRKK